MFLTLMVIGLVGLVVMALPALTGIAHGHGGAASGHGGTAHGPLGLRGLGALRGKGGAEAGLAVSAKSVAWTGLRFVPSPRFIFSLLALYGAFGNALVHAAHLGGMAAAIVAIFPTVLVERIAVAPLWNLAFRFQGQASSSLDALVLDEARAVTPFRNGRGVVSIVRDGRLVQFSARLVERDGAAQVGVGDRLLVEEVDTSRERLTVSLPAGPGASGAGSTGENT
jgi:hypothetical protein